MATIQHVCETFDRLRQQRVAGAAARVPAATEIVPAEIWESWSPAQLTALANALDAERTGDFFAADHAERSAPLKPCFTWGLSHAYCQLLGSLFPPLRPAASGPALGEASVARIDAATGQLQRDGFCVWPAGLPDQACDAIAKALRHVHFRVRGTDQIMDGFCDRNIYRPAGNTCWVIDPQEILRIPEVQALVCDPLLLTIVQSYLGCPPVHVRANCWWSIQAATPSADAASSTQVFHQDQEFARSVKVFVYLNDVTELNGPHVYIAGSARDYEQLVPSGYRVTQRLPDADLSHVYPPERQCMLAGPRGTLVFEDTRGFHKGLPIRCGYRLMLQLQYSCSLFFKAVPTFTLQGLSPELVACAARYPRTFLNYQHALYVRERAVRCERLDPAAVGSALPSRGPWFARLRRWLQRRSRST